MEMEIAEGDPDFHFNELEYSFFPSILSGHSSHAWIILVDIKISSDPKVHALATSNEIGASQ
jgi:hypothetical protein